MLSKWRQITVKHFKSSVVSASDSSFNGHSFWYDSLAIIKNFPIAGKSSSGKRFRCGPVSLLISSHCCGWSKFKFNCSSHISTNPATNWRKQSLSFYLFIEEKTHMFYRNHFSFTRKICIYHKSNPFGILLPLILIKCISQYDVCLSIYQLMRHHINYNSFRSSDKNTFNTLIEGTR